MPKRQGSTSVFFFVGTPWIIFLTINYPFNSFYTTHCQGQDQNGISSYTLNHWANCHYHRNREEFEYILCCYKYLLAISRILCSIGSNPLLLITIMFEFKNPLSRVCLSQAKTNAFHLPYREGKFVYFICLVLNLVWSLDATISQWWACKDYLTFWNWWWTWRSEAWGQSAIFGCSLPL